MELKRPRTSTRTKLVLVACPVPADLANGRRAAPLGGAQVDRVRGGGGDVDARVAPVRVLGPGAGPVNEQNGHECTATRCRIRSLLRIGCTHGSSASASLR